MTSHLIGTRQEWLTASAELLAREKGRAADGGHGPGWLRRRDEYPAR